MTLILYKLIFFETLIIFLESIYNQINYRNIWFVKVIMKAKAPFSMFFPKKTPIFMPLRQILISNLLTIMNI